MTSSGANIMQSMNILTAFWEEALAFKKELWQALQNPSILNPTIKFVEEIKDASDSSYQDSAGYVYDGWHWSFRASENRVGPGKKRTAGQLSVLVDIGGDLRPARVLGFPCIVVAWAHGSGADWKGEFRQFWPTEVAAATIISDRLFVQKDSSANGSMSTAHWFYILRLTDVRDPQALTRLLVSPVFDLIGGKPIGTIFTAAPEVLRFERRGEVVDLLPEKGSFRD